MEDRVDGIDGKMHAMGIQCDADRDSHFAVKIPSYKIEEKAEAETYNANCVKEMEGKDFNYEYVQEHGFDEPILVKLKEGLHMKVPNPDFGIMEVRAGLGSARLVEVKRTGSNVTQLMTMKELHVSWHKEKDPVLNPALVASVEFSHTKLENFVKAPLIVRQLDWVDRVWPRHVKLMQTESTSDIQKMMYPNVQKTVLMSMKGGFTDFHMQSGGASAWFHVLTGKVVFFLVDPENRKTFLSWTVHEEREKFFGDLAEKCGKVIVEPGQTFFLPAGWILAVYTPEDSLIFGGKFLHSYGIEQHIRVAVIEEATKVRQKLRFPFFTEILWYVMDRYVQVLKGKSYVCGNDEAVAQAAERPVSGGLGEENKDGNENTGKPHVHIPEKERKVLTSIMAYLRLLQPGKKVYPHLITDPGSLLCDVICVKKEHDKDDTKLAITGKPLLVWPGEYSLVSDCQAQPQSRVDERKKSAARGSLKVGRKSGSVISSGIKRNSSLKRPRRQRCKVCEGCQATDCRECSFCRDMIKYGGHGVMKQSCKDRKCTQPLLPKCCICVICEERRCKDAPNDLNDGLYECVTCADIAHESCMIKKYPGVAAKGVNRVKKEWVCHRCVRKGREVTSEVPDSVSGVSMEEVLEEV